MIRAYPLLSATILSCVTAPAAAQTVRGSGHVIPDRHVQIAARVGGAVTAVHAKVGQYVKRDDLLVQLDSRDLDLSTEQAESELAAKKAELVETQVELKATEQLLQVATELMKLEEKEFERARKLLERGAASKEQLDRIQREILAARNRVQELRSQREKLTVRIKLGETNLKLAAVRLELARRDLAATRVKAPFDGRVAGVAAAAGQYVRAGDRLVEVIDTSRLWAEVEFSATALPRLRGNPEAILRFPQAPNLKAGGRVEFVAPVVDPKTGGVRVRIGLERSEQILPGMKVEAVIEAPKGPGAR